MASLELMSRDLRRVALASGEVEYTLVRRRGRRGVGLKVNEAGLTVSAPITMPLARIEALVRESERWIVKKIAEWSGRQVPAAEWGEGAEVAFLGSAVQLRIARGPRNSARLADGELHVVVRNETP